MPDNEKPDDHPIPLRIVASLKSVSKQNALYGFGIKSEEERSLLPGLASKESLFSNLFRSENTINRAIKMADLEHYSNMKRQSDIIKKAVSDITDNSIINIMESLREKTGLIYIIWSVNSVVKMLLVRKASLTSIIRKMRSASGL